MTEATCDSSITNWRIGGGQGLARDRISVEEVDCSSGNIANELFGSRSFVRCDDQPFGPDVASYDTSR